MMTTSMTVEAATVDAELVSQSRDGNRDAFGQIVSRYQSLICSLAYSATGSLGQSEDLAQETFITAWKHLVHLREPHKLRTWLCGIARNRINNSLRREGREPLRGAEPLDTAREAPAPGPLPSDHAISREEEGILWRSLERIPDVYREPLVLFYREHQSVEKVSEALELSEDAVKQRLSRGRKLLHEEVLAFVEGALERTNPGKAFTAGVLAALPLFMTSAKAATLGAAAAKGGMLAKTAVSIGWAGAIVGPVIGILGGWWGTKVSLDNAQSARERRFLVRLAWSTAGFAVAFAISLGLLILAAGKLWQSHGVLLSVIMAGMAGGYVIALLSLILWSSRALKRIRREDAVTLPPGAAASACEAAWPRFEYRSRWTLFGLPCIHIRTGRRPEEKLRPAIGWIAIGDVAVGVLLAIGGISAGGVSIGGLALGPIALGGAGLGVLACGGLGIGVWAMGGVALGYLASGGCAVAWLAAQGGSAVAHEFAQGGAAFARHANDAAAQSFIESNRFFSVANGTMRSGWFQLVCWLPMSLVLWQALRLRKLRRVTAGKGIIDQG